VYHRCVSEREVALRVVKTTSEAAKKFGVTPARISQLRLWLKESWEQFQGEAGQVQVAAA
jgi:hypothetical protein